MGERSGADRFWWVFFIALSLLLGIGLVGQYSDHRVFVESHGKVLLSRQGVELLERNLAGILSEQERLLLGTTQRDIHAQVDKEVKLAFAAVHAQVPAYADFHYSLRGEYLQLGFALMGKEDKYLRQILFQDSEFESRLAAAMSRIQVVADRSLGESFGQLRHTTTRELQLSEVDQGLFARLITLSIADVESRFAHTMASIRVTGSVTGAGVGVATAKLGRKLVARSAGKVAGKTAARTMGLGEGATAGAAIGSMILPGPGTLAGGVVGGVVSWLATDTLILGMDEDMNREQFEAELHQVIEQEQQRTVLTLQTAYSQLLKAIHADNAAALKGLRPVDLVRYPRFITGRGDPMEEMK